MTDLEKRVEILEAIAFWTSFIDPMTQVKSFLAPDGELVARYDPKDNGLTLYETYEVD